MDSALTVTLQITVKMTRTQRDAYLLATGARFVGLDVRGRIRPDVREALQGIPWLRDHATVEISEPNLEA